MRTTVTLESILNWSKEGHENPFELLGPHEVDKSGRRALAVRAFLPHFDAGLGRRSGPRRGGPAHAADPSCRRCSRRFARPPRKGERRATCFRLPTKGERKRPCTTLMPFRTC